tara:strand:- start:1565 stop:1723 length:159 start_codon:yes stop_codon:yes gene_type:complete
MYILPDLPKPKPKEKRKKFNKRGKRILKPRVDKTHFDAMSDEELEEWFFRNS